MKAIALFLACGLAASGSAAPVRFEADGVRVGGDLVTGAALVMKGDVSPLLVSGRAVESLGSPVAVAPAEGLDLLLHAGVRLARAAQGEGWVLTTHGPALVLEAAGRSYTAASPVALKATEQGFDLSALGAPAASSLEVRLAAPKAPAPAVQEGRGNQDPVSPERARLLGLRSLNQLPVFGFGDPTILGAAALKYNLASPPLTSP
jgi:hypothetical protein